MFKQIFQYLKTLGQAKWVKGAELSVMGAVGTALYTTLSAGTIPLTLVALKPILLVGLTTGLSYLLHPVAGAPAETPKQ